MRTLIIVLIIFSLLCGAIALNSLYINNVGIQLNTLVHSLDFANRSDCEKKLDEINSVWQNSSDIFSISVNYKDIDYFGETLISLVSAFDNNDKKEFERYRLLLIDAIDGVCRLEKPTLFNII